jgi:hypothetical protein
MLHVWTELHLPLGISKQSKPTKQNVATFEKSLPWRCRSVLSPMTAAYYFCISISQGQAVFTHDGGTQLKPAPSL